MESFNFVIPHDNINDLAKITTFDNETFNLILAISIKQALETQETPFNESNVLPYELKDKITPLKHNECVELITKFNKNLCERSLKQMRIEFHKEYKLRERTHMLVYSEAFLMDANNVLFRLTGIT